MIPHVTAADLVTLAQHPSSPGREYGPSALLMILMGDHRQDAALCFDFRDGIIEGLTNVAIEFIELGLPGLGSEMLGGLWRGVFESLNIGIPMTAAYHRSNHTAVEIALRNFVTAKDAEQTRLS